MPEKHTVELPMLRPAEAAEQERKEREMAERVAELKKEMNKDVLAERVAVLESELEQARAEVEQLRAEKQVFQQEFQHMQGIELNLRRELDAYRTQVIQNQQNQLNFLQQANGSAAAQPEGVEG